MLNFYLRDHPEQLLALGPKWIFGSTECISPVLSCCLDTGVMAIHGADAIFYREQEYVFQVFIYLYIKLYLRVVIVQRDEHI